MSSAAVVIGALRVNMCCLDFNSDRLIDYKTQCVFVDFFLPFFFVFFCFFLGRGGGRGVPKTVVCSMTDTSNEV